jgi:XTP/dITP diphosphohydrolase
MAAMRQLVLASSNPGKLREIEALLAPLGIEVIAQSALGVAEAEEPHFTFVENALAKARHASRAAKLPALADDSGLCVEALGGEPGVHSARFAGESPAADRATQDARNNEKLVRLLAGKGDRRAHYDCVLALVRHADDPEPLIAEGRWAGEIVDAPRGANGFGYDPHFFLREFGRTAAELEPAEKNRVSHRGKALARLLAELKAESRP